MCTTLHVHLCTCKFSNNLSGVYTYVHISKKNLTKVGLGRLTGHSNTDDGKVPRSVSMGMWLDTVLAHREW